MKRVDGELANQRSTGINFGPQGPGAAHLPTPRDIPYPAPLSLRIDAGDCVRGIVRGHLSLPVAEPGPMTLLYPKWMPGYHSPQNPIELFAGLDIRAGEVQVDWQRDPVEVYAFHIDVPEGTDRLEIDFQFLSPTSSDQGDVVVTEDILLLQWGRLLVYPAGYYARRIEVEAVLTLPPDWEYSTVLETEGRDGSTVTFKPVALEVLVDSPVMAGRHMRAIPLDTDEEVSIALFAHDPADSGAQPDQVALHSNLVVQARRLFASKHFDRYRFLAALSDELGGGGVEHHRSAEIILPPDYFREWDKNLSKRDVFAHEFTHSWNGKFRRGVDSWTPSFEIPIRNSLMWVYEGQTQYWGHVLTARAGLWSTSMAVDALAKIAAVYDVRPGGLWRTMADTTRDPVIAGRSPLPWPSWQRSEDYYSQGQLLWLAIDTLLRELSKDRHSLDDFAKAFFGRDDGRIATSTYDFDDVIATLRGIVDHDWAGLITEELESREPGAPLEGIERGGYRLIYRPHRNDFCRNFDARAGQLDMRFSIGLNIGDDGTIQEVMWDSPGFAAGLTAGALIRRVNGEDYSPQAIGKAIAEAQAGGDLNLAVRTRPESRTREVAVDYREGHRFPHLEPIEGARPRLQEIFSPR